MSKKKFLILLMAFFSTYHALGKECVLLIHGLGRSSLSMLPLKIKLERKNYKVINMDYDSQEISINQAAGTTLPNYLRQCGASKNVHFITHSLGGIVLRQFFSKYSLLSGPYKNSLIVMLAPPNQGSVVAEKLKKYYLARKIMGPALTNLSVGKGSIISSLKPLENKVGIIAGIFPYIFSAIIPGDDDGFVSVESTKLPEMADHFTFAATHTFIMNKEKTYRQILYFFENERFYHDD